MARDQSYFGNLVNQPSSVKINGVDLRTFGLELSQYPNLLLPPITERIQIIEGFSGARDFGATYGPSWSFELQGQLVGLDHFDLIDKKTKLLRFIDQQQHHAAEWLVSSYGVGTLKFEISGDRNFYTEGTITATNGSATITGSGTYFKSYLVTGSEFRIQDDPATGLSTRYIVLRVDSDTSLTLTTNVTRATASGLTYQAERKRYLLVNYNGTSDINTSGLGPPMRTKVMNISVGFRSLVPYWIGDEFTFEQDSAQYFYMLRGVGTAPFGPTYQLVGASTNPEICACELAFNARFDGDTKARTVLNKADVTGTLTEGVVYRAGKLGTGQAIEIYGDGTRGRGDEVYFFSKTDESDPGANEAPVFGAANRINYNQGSLSMWICTSWDGPDDRTHIFFINQEDASNRIYLWKDSDNLINFAVNDATAQSVGAITTTEITANTWHHIFCRWDCRTIIESSKYVQVFIDNVEEASSTSNPANPNDVDPICYIGCSSGGANSIDALVDDFAIWDRPLSNADKTAIYASGAGVTADNYSNGLITYFNFDGSGALTDTVNAGLGSQSSVTLRSTATTTTDVTVTKNGSDIFADNDRFVLWDSTGYKVAGFVNEGLTSTNIPIEATLGGDGAVTGADKVGVSLDFDATYTAVAANNTIHDITTGDIGISIWVRFVADGNPRYIIAKAINGAVGYGLNINSASVLQCFIHDGTDSYLLAGNTAIGDNKWHHLAAIIDKSNAANCKLFLDGYEDGTTNKTGTLVNVGDITNAQILTIGADSNLAYKWAGQIRDAVIAYPADIMAVNEMGAAGEILTLATSPLDTGNYCNSEDFWVCTENTGTTITGNVNNLTLSNALAWDQECFISKDLIADSGMENGGIGGWRPNTADPPDSITKDTSTIYKDAQSIKTINAGAGFKGFYTTVVLGNGENYLLRYWSSRTGNMFQAFKTSSSSVGSNWLGPEVESNPVNNGITEHAFQSGQAGTAYLHFYSNNVANTIYVDDIKLLPNLVDNGGMETGGVVDVSLPTSWVARGTPASLYKANTASNGATGKVHSGTFSIYTSADEANEGAYCLTPVVNGLAYELSCWVWVVSGSAQLSTGNQLTVKNAITSSTGQWERLSYITLAVVTGNVAVFVESLANNDVFYYDDVSIVHRPDLDATINFLDEGYHYIASKNDKGAYIRGGDTLYYTGTIVNNNQFSFCARFEVQFEPGTGLPDGPDKYLFQTYYDASNDFRVYFDVSAQDWVLGINSGGSEDTTIRTTNTQSFSIGDILEISGYFGCATYTRGGVTYDAQGHTVDGITYFGKIFVNGIESGSVTTAPTTPVTSDYSATLFVGGSYLTATLATNQGDIVMDELLLWELALTDDDLASLYTSGEPIQNTNATISYQGILSAQDLLTYSASNGASELYDASAGTESNPGSSISGKNPSLRGDEEEKQLVYLPASVAKFRTILRPHFR